MITESPFAICDNDFSVVEKAGFDADYVYSLTMRWGNLDCHVMATAMHDLTGWKIRALNEDTIVMMPPIHAFLETPDGALVDVYGVFQGEEGRTEMIRRYDILNPVWRDPEPWEIELFRSDSEMMTEAGRTLSEDPWFRAVLECAGYQPQPSNSR